MANQGQMAPNQMGAQQVMMQATNDMGQMGGQQNLQMNQPMQNYQIQQPGFQNTAILAQNQNMPVIGYQNAMISNDAAIANGLAQL